MKILVFILFILHIVNYSSQTFEGQIEFDVINNYKDSSIISKNNSTNKMNYFISGEFSRIDQTTTIGKQSFIIDTLTKSSLLLINLMEKKIGIKINDVKDTNHITEIKYIDQYKVILNYNCQKAIVNSYNKTSNNITTTTIYFTEEISNSYSNNFEGLKGFPLSYEINSKDLTSSYLAVKIYKKKIDPQYFINEKDTEIYSLDEFKNLMNQ